MEARKQNWNNAGEKFNRMKSENNGIKINSKKAIHGVCLISGALGSLLSFLIGRNAGLKLGEEWTNRRSSEIFSKPGTFESSSFSKCRMV